LLGGTSSMKVKYLICLSNGEKLGRRSSKRMLV
jgi:hypothetical protein